MEKIKAKLVELKNRVLARIKNRQFDVTFPTLKGVAQISCARPFVETFFIRWVSWTKLPKIQIDLTTTSHLKVWIKKHHKEVQLVLFGFACCIFWKSKFLLDEEPRFQEAMNTFAKEKDLFDRVPSQQTPAKAAKLKKEYEELMKWAAVLNED